MKKHLKIEILDHASLKYILHFTYCPRTVFSLKKMQSESTLKLKKKKKGSIWFFPLRYLLYHMSKQSNYMTKYSNRTWYLNSVHTSSFVLLVKCFDHVLSPMFLQFLHVVQKFSLPAIHQIITITYLGQKKNEVDSHWTCLNMQKPKLILLKMMILQHALVTSFIKYWLIFNLNIPSTNYLSHIFVVVD